MARVATREERIRFKMHDNFSDPMCNEMEKTREYCEAFVDGEMAIEKEVAKMVQPTLVHENALDATYYDVRGNSYKLVKTSSLSPTMQAVCSIMIETEVRQGPDYDKKYVAYPSTYGAGCLIEGLRMKGYEIVKREAF